MAQMTEDYLDMGKFFRGKEEPLLAVLYEIAAQLSRLNDNLEDVTGEGPAQTSYIRTGD